MLNKPLISKNIRPCSADIPAPPLKPSGDNILSTAVFDTNLIWSPGDTGSITITFNENSGAWSYLGIQSKGQSPSMNLGWVDAPLQSFSQDGFTFNSSEFINTNRNYCNTGICNSDGEQLQDDDGNTYTCENGVACMDGFEPGAVVIHEFGHALGMYHEHQNYLDSGNPIVYDLDGSTLFSLHQQYGTGDLCVQSYCSKFCYEDGVRPYFCDDDGCNRGISISSSCQSKWESAKRLATTNVLERYECTANNCPYEGSSYDNNSVMLYQVDDYMIEPDSNGERVNPTKANFAYSDSDKEWLSIMYPLENTNPPTIDVKFNGGEDWQKYWVKKVVMEKLKPCVGINFVFDLPVQEESIYSNECVYKSGTLPVNPTTSGPTEVNTDSNNEGSSIMLYIFLGIIVLAFLGGLVFL